MQEIEEDYSFHECLKRVSLLLGASCSAIELGGFPGGFSIYLKKYCFLDVTLLDYYIDQQVISSVLKRNQLRPRDVKVIEADIFTYNPENTYDLVCSFGLIEHFTNLEQVLRCHLKFMKPGGLLFVTLPNFCGVNGLLQKIFDPANLAIHNLAVMDLVLLRNALSALGMLDIQVEYYPSSQVWLEDIRNRHLIIQVIVRIVNKAVKFLAKLFGLRSRWFSNSIVIFAKKPLNKIADYHAMGTPEC